MLSTDKYHWTIFHMRQVQHAYNKENWSECGTSTEQITYWMSDMTRLKNDDAHDEDLIYLHAASFFVLQQPISAQLNRLRNNYFLMHLLAILLCYRTDRLSSFHQR